MAEIILTYISLGIAIISILFVVWDHFKDDRLLTKRAQSFYKNIENLIFYFFKMKATEKLWDESPDNKEYENNFSEYETKHLFYMGRFQQNFEEYSKYLGLTKYRGDQVFMNGSDYLLERTGDILNLYTNIKASPKLNRNRTFWDNNRKKHILNDGSIIMINNFLETLREFWKKHYYKPIFRKNLKQKLDFSELAIKN